MENQTALERLDERITQILQKCEDLKHENETLRNELVTAKAEGEIKDAEIEKLLEENSKKDLEIEEIVNKIESILG
jgi:chromosome segregation ATPase